MCLLFSFKVKFRPGDGVAGGAIDVTSAQRHPGQGAEAGWAGPGERQQLVRLRQEQAGERPQHEEVTSTLPPCPSDTFCVVLFYFILFVLFCVGFFFVCFASDECFLLCLNSEQNSLHPTGALSNHRRISLIF
jgi:hypothetical protein